MTFNLANVRKDKVAAGKVVIYWLGGSGYVLKFSSGQIVCIDPYLSDYVEELVGFRRLSLPPVTADELFFDLLLITHDHPDHLDVGSFDELMKTNPDCTVIASPVCAEFLKKKKHDHQIVSPGDSCMEGVITVRTVRADHGELCPEAVGFMVGFGDRQIYFTGDTSDNKEIMAENSKLKPQILLPCINGAFGNLDAKQAAVLARRCEAQVVIPCHFWLFAEHNGDPGKFRDILKVESPDSELILAKPGVGYEV